MPSTKEIRAKIRSVHNTRKITKAMEMVAASKMKKAQDRMRAARPYGNTIRNLIGHLADASTEAVHPFLRKVKEVNNIGLICVSTDKGLAGALNQTFRDFLLILSEIGHKKAKKSKLLPLVTRAWASSNALASRLFPRLRS